MKLNEIKGKPKAISTRDLIDSIKDGVFTKNGNSLQENGTFLCPHQHLRSLEGCPQEVRGDFYCHDNKLVNLKGAPLKVEAMFDCASNKLTTLDGAQNMQAGSFECRQNLLTDLKGAPKKVKGFFSCEENKLTSLEGIPEHIGRYLNASLNKLTSLKDIHKHLKSLNGTFYADENPIKSHVLGLLKISGCDSVILDNIAVQNILNKYLPLGDLIDCQEELIEAGFEEYAQL